MADRQDARFINCDLLVALSPYLRRLKTFKLLGCGHVGPKGIFSVLESAQATLEDVSLEGVNLVSSLRFACAYPLSHLCRSPAMTSFF